MHGVDQYSTVKEELSGLLFTSMKIVQVNPGFLYYGAPGKIEATKK